MDGEAGEQVAGLGRAMGIVTGTSRGFSWSLACLLALRLMPGSVLLLLARSAAVLEQLEGELRTACPALCVRGLPANLASNDGLQHMVHAAWELHRDGPMERLLLINNAVSDNRGKSNCCTDAQMRNVITAKH
nr:sepiapterin reductase-like [Zootoca vivipara]